MRLVALSFALALLGTSSSHAVVRYRVTSWDDGERPKALVLGDSNIYGTLGKALATSLSALGYDVARYGKPTSGLARPDFFDWPTYAAEVLSEFDADVVFFMFGGNDGQRLTFVASGAERVWFREQEPWRDEYAERVESFAKLLRGDHRRVFLLSPTNRRSRIERSKMERVKDVQRGATEGLERVTWIDMYPFSSDSHGGYLSAGVDLAGASLSYRRGDGIHLTPAGGVEVARRLLTDLLERGIAACDCPI